MATKTKIIKKIVRFPYPKEVVLSRKIKKIIRRHQRPGEPEKSEGDILALLSNTSTEFCKRAFGLLRFCCKRRSTRTVLPDG